MAINLSGAKTAVERLLLVDNCQILKGEHRAGGTWNPTTHTFTEVANAVLYDGECQVSSRRNLPRPNMQGGELQSETPYAVKIPLDAEVTEEILPRDVVRITEVHDGGDELLIGREFIVESVGASTYSVLRKISIVRYEPTPQ